MTSALPSERYEGRIWRLVEAQNVISTLALVDSLEEQEILEKILEWTKPQVPPECRHLDYLLFTPFRYGRYPSGSRFRRGGRTPGVFYGAEKALTAAMEVVWWRLHVFDAASGMKLPAGGAEYTGFAVELNCRAVDLTGSALAGRGRWEEPEDYSDCQDLADAARDRGIGAIRYRSVRDPDKGINLAVLACGAFARPQPVAHESWRIVLRPGGAVIIRENPRAKWEVQRRGTGLAWRQAG